MMIDETRYRDAAGRLRNLVKDIASRLPQQVADLLQESVANIFEVPSNLSIAELTEKVAILQKIEQTLNDYKDTLHYSGDLERCGNAINLAIDLRYLVLPELKAQETAVKAAEAAAAAKRAPEEAAAKKAAEEAVAKKAAEEEAAAAEEAQKTPIERLAGKIPAKDYEYFQEQEYVIGTLMAEEPWMLSDKTVESLKKIRGAAQNIEARAKQHQKSYPDLMRPVVEKITPFINELNGILQSAEARELEEAKAWFGDWAGEPSEEMLKEKEAFFRRLLAEHEASPDFTQEEMEQRVNRDLEKTRRFYSILKPDAVLLPTVVEPFRSFVNSAALSRLSEINSFNSSFFSPIENKMNEDIGRIKQLCRDLSGVECLPERQSQETQERLFLLVCTLKSFEKDFYKLAAESSQQFSFHHTPEMQKLHKLSVFFRTSLIPSDKEEILLSKIPDNLRQRIQAEVNQREYVHVPRSKTVVQPAPQQPKQPVVQPASQPQQINPPSPINNPSPAPQHQQPKQPVAQPTSQPQQPPVQQTQSPPVINTPSRASSRIGRVSEADETHQTQPDTLRNESGVTTSPARGEVKGPAGDEQANVSQAQQGQQPASSQPQMVNKTKLNEVIVEIHQQRRHSNWFTKILSFFGLNLRQTKETLTDDFTTLLNEKSGNDPLKAISEKDLEDYLNRFKEAQEYLEQKRPSKDKADEMIKNAFDYIKGDGSNQTELLPGFKTSKDDLRDPRSQYGFGKEETRHAQVMEKLRPKK